jgi:hypothetical protein
MSAVCAALAYYVHCSISRQCMCAVNGRTVTVPLRNLSAREVARAVQRVKDVSGHKVRLFPQTTLTKTSSIQGNWHPFLH